MTRESQVYLGFVRNNLPLLLLPALISGAMAGFYQQQRPAVEHLNSLLEMSYTQDNVQSQIQLTDQAVSLLREVNIQKQLEIGETAVQAYKPGPLLLTLDVSGADDQQLRSSLGKLQKYAESRFPLSQQGEIVQTFQKDSVWIWAVFGTVFGILLGLFFSLLKTYLLYY